jgi:putative ubiquitin-RnfH superfamily antitoxin RatB of RatAB toxin-antitoxin module
MVNEAGISVTIIYSPWPRQSNHVPMTLAEPCTVLQALKSSGLLEKFPEIDNLHIPLGIWGRKVGISQLLRDQDRVEVYRPLRVDPKVARRERFVKQGARSAGLFVKRREGAKPGY